MGNLRVAAARSSRAPYRAVDGDRQQGGLGARFGDRVALAWLPDALAREQPADRRGSIVLGAIEHGEGWFQRDDGPRIAAYPGMAFMAVPPQLLDIQGLTGVEGWVLTFSPSVVGMTSAVDGRLTAHPAHPGWLSFLRPADLAARLELPAPTAREWSDRARKIHDELASVGLASKAQQLARGSDRQRGRVEAGMVE